MPAIRSRGRRVAAATIIVLHLAAAVSGVPAQQSSSYRIDRLTLSATSGPVSSQNYATTITFAQEGPVGSVSRCNDGFLQSTGFWSVLGETPAPVRLRVARNDIDPTLIDLNWSGSASQFVVYRAESPDSVVDLLNELITTPACATSDAPPAAAPIVFYLVRPAGS